MGDERGDLSTGDTLGDFRVIKPLGRGGMGVVYLARDERLERRVALKVIAPHLAADEEFRERFISEARSAAAIEHDNAVPVYSAGVVDGVLYIAMRYVDGTDLRTVLAEDGPLDPRETVSIVAEVAGALDAAHTAGLVHRDIKPANILLRGAPGNRTGYLTDFGLTKGGSSSSDSLTATGKWVGTIDYVAPEQIQTGQVDARTDVYALGCVLYAALTGSAPYSGDDMQKMWGHVNEPFPALTGEGDVERLAGVVERATAKSPDDRFPSAGALAEAAAAALAGSAPSAPPAPAAGKGATVTAAAGPAVDRHAPTVAAPSFPPIGDGPHERQTSPLNPSPRPRGSGGGTRTAAIVAAAVIVAAGLLAAAIVIAGGNSSNEVPPVATTAEPEPERTSANRTPPPTEGAGSGTNPNQVSFQRDLDAGNLEAVPDCATPGVYRRLIVRPGGRYASAGFACNTASLALETRSPAYFRAGGSVRIQAWTSTFNERIPMSCAGPYPIRCEGGVEAVAYISG